MLLQTAHFTYGPKDIHQDIHSQNEIRKLKARDARERNRWGS